MTTIEYFKLPTEICFSNEEINYIWENRPNNQHTIKLYGKEVLCPRLQECQGKDYYFSGAILKAKPIDNIYKKLIDFLNTKYKVNFNMLLINWYRDGKDYIGPHSDDETSIKNNTPIITVSLGITRDFILKDNITKERQIYKLENNSVLVMGGTCQKTHKHSLPQRKKIKDYRISITLREFI